MSKLLSVGNQFVRHVLPAALQPIRILWNELIGFLFIAFGVLSGFSTYRQYTGQGQASGSPVVLLMGGGFTLLLLYFGWSSFRSARRISRS